MFLAEYTFRIFARMLQRFAGADSSSCRMVPAPTYPGRTNSIARTALEDVRGITHPREGVGPVAWY